MTIIFDIGLALGSILAWIFAIAIVVPVGHMLLYGSFELKNEEELQQEERLKIAAKNSSELYYFNNSPYWISKNGKRWVKYDIWKNPKNFASFLSGFAPLILALSIPVSIIGGIGYGLYRIVHGILNLESRLVNRSIDKRNDLNKIKKEWNKAIDELVASSDEERKRLIESAKKELEAQFPILV